MKRRFHPVAIASMLVILALSALGLSACSNNDTTPAPTATPKAMNGKSPDEQVKLHQQQMQNSQGSGGQ